MLGWAVVGEGVSEAISAVLKFSAAAGAVFVHSCV